MFKSCVRTLLVSAMVMIPASLACNAQTASPDEAGNTSAASERARPLFTAPSAGNIQTIAGNGSLGNTGSGIAATSAAIGSPCGLVFDNAGNLFFTDILNGVVHEVNATTGVITTIAGNGTNGSTGDKGPATSAELNEPCGIAVDGTGNVYISEYQGNRIRMVDASTHTISTVVGTGTGGFSGDGGAPTTAQINEPGGIALDSNGNLYIADGLNNRIRKVTVSGGAVATGVISTVAGTSSVLFNGDGIQATAANLSYPIGVAVDSDGNLYIADNGHYRIRKVTEPGGVISTIAGNGTRNQTPYTALTTGLATGLPIDAVQMISVDSKKNVYITDIALCQVYKVDGASDNLSLVAGYGPPQFASTQRSGFYSGDGGPAVSAGLGYPETALADPNGNVYIADDQDGRIREVAPGTSTLTDTPIFSPIGGVFTSEQSVTITDLSPGALIYYTTDGTTPTTSSTPYSGSFNVNTAGANTVMAIAKAPSLGLSVANTQVYYVDQYAAAPVFNPSSGNFTSPQTVTMSSTTPGAVIYYTTNGSSPTASSTVYTAPIAVNASETIKAFATAQNYIPSTVASSSYVLNLSIPPPTFSPTAGVFGAAQTVSISDTLAGAVVYYTTNGTAPTTSSTKYTGPITVSSTETIQAIATATYYPNSPVASATYTIEGTAVTPTFSLPAGTYNTTQYVTLSSTTPGAVIYYTTDGSLPTVGSTKFSAAIVLTSSPTTIKAIATASGYVNSTVASATYILTPVAPVFSPVAGTYTGTQSVTITDSTPGTVIHYTTDGTTPSASSNAYGQPISVSASETIQAVAVKTGYATSAVGTAAYTINSSIPLAAPTISPGGGLFPKAQTVTITDATTAAVIYYTTDGSTPTASSLLYTGPITVSGTETIEAIATGAGHANSAVSTAYFTIQANATAPTFTPPPGTFYGTQTVIISDAMPGTTIYYTTNGTTPTTSSSTIITGNQITVRSTETIELMATATGFANSPVVSGTYTINSVAATPTFSVPGGTYSSVQTVSLSDTTPGANIYYTTNGTTPTINSTQYLSPITVSTSETIEAIAARPGGTASGVALATYTIAIPAATPTFSPGPSTYSVAPGVNISDTTPGAVIYYTTNGTTPTTSSTRYTGPVTIAASETLQAIAVASGFANSAVASGVYNLVAGAPYFSPAPGTYTAAQTVYIQDLTPNVNIYFTTDGSTPTTNSPRYGGPITVSSTETIQAIATSKGYTTSPVGSGTFTINLPPAATPTFTPVGGTYGSTQTVTISDATSGAIVFFTTDGSKPTTSSPEYGGPVTVSSTETIQAIAMAAGHSQSAVGSATYTIGKSVAAPTFSPVAGTYAVAQTISLSDSTSGAVIYFTTNGTTPTTGSTKYTSPITVSSTETINAIATATGYSNNSPVASATYTIAPDVAAPVFSPPRGTYTTPQNVSISDSTPGATIYYTTNGTPATTSSTVYTGPIPVSTTETINVMVTATGYSAISTSSIYTIAPVLPTPTFSVAGGTYTAAQTVSISDATTGAVIYYTTNGSAPTTSSTLYTGPITVSSTETIEAFATGTGYTNSVVGSVTYTIAPLVATPTFSVAGGTYTTTQTVSITDTTTGALIYFTTNGSTPTASSTPYTGPITVSATETIEAIAIASGHTNSAVASATYTIAPLVATPTFSVAGGTYTTTQTVSISDSTAGALIYYTTNGSTPSASSTPYAGPITVSSTETIEAIAIKASYTNSAVATATYTIAPVLATPAFSQPTGTYTNSVSVSITDSTGAAQIYYTTNGTTPTAGSTLYSGPITVIATETINAIAIATGYTNSAVATATYTIAPAVPAPTFSPSAGSYPAGQTVTISDTMGGAVIYYTINSATPTTSSTRYTGPITVSSPEYIKAIATATGYSNSPVTSGYYGVESPAATPVFSPSGGTFTAVQNVGIYDTTPGAAIYYTTNGTTPTTSSTLYTTPVSVSSSETIQAIAVASGYANSAVGSAAFTINIPLGISAVSAILPQQTQNITITGKGFGSLSPYSGNSLYIQFNDYSRVGWGAGYSTDAVGLAVTSWTDTQIQIAGLTGSYGNNGWALSNGDKITIVVTNPQTSAGPYTCSNVVVGAGATVCTSSPAASPHSAVPKPRRK